jgi:hypothetical protein
MAGTSSRPKERISRGINEINAEPVVFRWTKFGKAER